MRASERGDVGLELRTRPHGQLRRVVASLYCIGDSASRARPYGYLWAVERRIEMIERATFDPEATRGVTVDAGDDTGEVTWQTTATIASLDVTAETINLSSGSVNTGSGDQTYTGAVVLGANTTLTGTDVAASRSGSFVSTRRFTA